MKKSLRIISVILTVMFAMAFLSACDDGGETVSVTYSLGGGSISGSAPSSFTKDDVPDFSKIIPKREHYNFAGWYTDMSCTTKFRESEIKGNHVTLYAKWSAHKYNIIYELNGGVGDELPTEYNYGTSIRISVLQPKRENYTFEGWYTDAEFKTLKTKISPTDVGDVTLYAKWSPIG